MNKLMKLAFIACFFAVTAYAEHNSPSEESPAVAEPESVPEETPVAVEPLIAPPVAAPVAEAAPPVEPVPAEPAPKAPVVYTGSNPCHKEMFDLPSSKKDFNVSGFIKDLGISVAKVKASCKTKFTCPDDKKVMDVGLTAGCIKQLPTTPMEITDLLKSIGMDLTVSAALDLAAQSPAAIESNVEKVEKKGRSSFWVALTLDLIGAGLITYGVIKNSDVNKYHRDYRNVPIDSPFFIHDAMWEKVEDAKGTRNIMYIAGGLILATGIGVHIWF